MKTRSYLYSILLLMLLTPAQLTFAGDAYTKQKVVYHVNYDDAKRQAGALRNIQNHINAVGAENLDLKVVMHGNGLSLLVYPDSVGETKLKHGNADDAMQARIAGLKNQNVKFQICKNTLKGKKVSVEDHLYDASEKDIVPSGVAEIAKLQAEGYAYLRP